MRLRLLSVPSAWWHTSCSLNNLSHIVAQLRHSSRHVLGQNIAERSKGVEFTAHELVTTTYELDELSCVDVRVTAVFDIFEEFWGYGGEVMWW